MKQIARREQFHSGWVRFMGLGLGLIVSLGSAASVPARAAQVASDIKLDADDLNHPIVLDQNGRRILMPTQGHTGPVVLPSGSIPSYLVYRVDSDDSLPKDFPTVATGPAKAGRTTGPLHLDAAVKAQLDQALAQDGKVAVYNGKNTLLVKPIAPLFGSAGAGDNGTTLTWLASQAAATRSASGSSSSSSSLEHRRGLQLDKRANHGARAQVLIPANIADPIMNSKLIKDLEHLVSIQHGKMPNWNQQTLNALKADLGISSPRNVAPHLAASASKTTLEAQTLDLSSTGTGTPSPAPVPEPGSVVIFGLAAFALAARSRLGRRSPRA